MKISPIVRTITCSAFFLLAGSNVSSWAQSARPGIGAIPYSDGGGNGVTFRTWAPNATSVGVKGQFNGWASTPMVNEGTGWWSIDVPGAQVGQEYKYRMNNSFDRRDARSSRVVNSAGNSIIYDHGAFDWQGQDSFSRPWMNDLVIYEMHVGTYNAESWVPSTFDQVIQRLDHIEEMGINAIQVMPVNEFAADKSWGYNPSDLFAIESALGGPDAFKRFVRECHSRGIAVLVDVVHNHYGPSDLGLWQYDGWSQNGLGGIYFYNDSKAYTWWGDTRPDYGRSEVRDFIRDSIFMFMNDYKVDGFRWDSVFNIIYYNSGSSHNPDGESLLRDLNWDLGQGYPGVYRFSEDHAFDFNMNFDSQWDVAFSRHLKWQVEQVNDADRNVNWLGDKIAEWPSHQRILFSESHDEVGDLNDKERLPRAIDPGDPSSIWARKRQLLAASVVLTSPGIPMIFQGQEMNDDWDFSAETALRWGLTNLHAGIVRAYGDMIKLRRNKFGTTQGLKGTGVNVHHRDNGNKVLGMVRWDAGGGSDDVVVVMNLASTVWNSNTYFIEFPSEGTWYIHYNSDAQRYGGDFGNIGGTQVTASGNPATAAVNMGQYATLIMSKTPRPAVGIVSANPALPDGCVPVEISFEPNGGPLNGATNVNLVVGNNGFQFPVEISMTNQSGTWVTTFDIPFGSYQVDMAFNNGDGTWDSNFGDNWSFPVSSCADIPSSASVVPAQPQGCDPLTVTYQAGAGVLLNASNVNLYIGRNGWQDIETIALAETSPGVWTNRYEMPPDTWQIDFVFNGQSPSNTVWDNNNGQDWGLIVSGCIDSETPGVFITNPVASITVSNGVTNFTFRGFSSSNMVGQLQWSNKLTGMTSWVPAGGTPWTVMNMPLGEGANIFQIKGFSDTINANDGASDATSNFPYSVLDDWNDGDNGGVKWGGGWQLSGGPTAGHFLADTNTGNLDLGESAWGLWAYDGGLSSAVRPLKTRMNVGDEVCLTFENNSIDGGNVVGVGFQNRFGQNLFEYLFVGGDTNYLINDSLLTRTTGIPWSDQPQDLCFQLTSPTEYAFTADGLSFTGTLAVSSETVVDRVRIFNFSAGGGSEKNVYVDNLYITGPSLPSIIYQTEVTVTRSYGPNSDPDGDQYKTWEEEVAGTNPFDGLSRLPDAALPAGIGVMTVGLGQSVAGKWYDIYTSTNLMHGGWNKTGLSRPGTGSGISLVFTNYQPELFYRTGVSTSP